MSVSIGIPLTRLSVEQESLFNIDLKEHSNSGLMKVIETIKAACAANLSSCYVEYDEDVLKKLTESEYNTEICWIKAVVDLTNEHDDNEMLRTNRMCQAIFVSWDKPKNSGWMEGIYNLVFYHKTIYRQMEFTQTFDLFKEINCINNE